MHSSVVVVILAVIMLAFGIVGAVLASPDRPRNPAFWASLGVIAGAIALLIEGIPLT